MRTMKAFLSPLLAIVSITAARSPIVHVAGGVICIGVLVREGVLVTLPVLFTGVVVCVFGLGVEGVPCLSPLFVPCVVAVEVDVGVDVTIVHCTVLFGCISCCTP